MSAILRLLALVTLISVLAGCVISGPRDLVTDAEAVTPLPAEFTFYPYSEQQDGTYIRSNGDKPMPFKLAGKRYDSADGEMVLRLAPIAGSDTYLLAVEGKGESDAIYGSADVSGDIIALRIILDSKLDREAVDALSGITPELSADLTLKDQGITVSRRDTLDFAIGKLVGGELKAGVLLAWIGTGEPPEKLVPDGDGYKVAP